MENSSPPPKRHAIDAAPAALWASAFLLAALVVMQAGRVGNSAAFAGNVAEVGGLRLLTADAGNGEEFIAVLNPGEEVISIYGIENGRNLELYQAASIADLFEQARAGVNPGTPRR